MLIDSIWYMPCMVTIDMEYSYTGTNVSLTYTHAHVSAWRLPHLVDMSQWVLLCLSVGGLAI